MGKMLLGVVRFLAAAYSAAMAMLMLGAMLAEQFGWLKPTPGEFTFSDFLAMALWLACIVATACGALFAKDAPNG